MKEEYNVITYVPEDEPTLDVNLGECAKVANKFGETVLLTNGSLAFMKDVREGMAEFDVVSLKLDAGRESTWRKVNRPHSSLSFGEVLEGMKTFTKTFRGGLVAETMIIKGINDSKDELELIADTLDELKPRTAFLMVPVRPPTLPVEGGNVELAYKIISERVNAVVVSGDPFKFYPKDKNKLKEIARVHPVPLKLIDEVPEGCEVVEHKGEKYVRC